MHSQDTIIHKFAIVECEIYPYARHWSKVLYIYLEDVDKYFRYAYYPIKEYSLYNKVNRVEFNKWYKTDIIRPLGVFSKEDITYTYPNKKTTFFKNVDELGEILENLVLDFL